MPSLHEKAILPRVGLNPSQFRAERKVKGGYANWRESARIRQRPRKGRTEIEQESTGTEGPAEAGTTSGGAARRGLRALPDGSRIRRGEDVGEQRAQMGRDMVVEGASDIGILRQLRPM